MDFESSHWKYFHIFLKKFYFFEKIFQNFQKISEFWDFDLSSRQNSFEKNSGPTRSGAGTQRHFLMGAAGEWFFVLQKILENFLHFVLVVMSGGEWWWGMALPFNNFGNAF